MSRAHAHHILDAAREGLDVPAALIRRALVATGDLAPHHMARMDAGYQPEHDMHEVAA